MNAKKVFVIAHYTFLETVKSKLLLGVVFLALALCFVSYIASALTYGSPEKVALDVGLGLTSLAAKVIAIFYGVGIIQHEIENRTIYLILSRPVTKVQYLFGRLFGMGMMLMLNVVILGVFSLVAYLLMGGSIDSLMLWTLLFTFFESLLLLLLVVVFSLFSSKVLAILLAISSYVAGFSAHTLIESQQLSSEFLKNTLKIISFILPDFSRLNLKDYLLYQQELPIEFFVNSTLHSLFFMLSLLFIGSILMRTKSLD